MGQWDKLVADILKLNKNLRFDDLAKALVKMGYTMSQPGRGGSHHIFRKEGRPPMTIPRRNPVNKAYIELAAEAVRQYLNESEDS